jgi:hypothetical protein
MESFSFERIERSSYGEMEDAEYSKRAWIALAFPFFI